MSKRKIRKTIDAAWATCAIGLGVWETTALTTKRIPTISNTCAIARAQRRRSTEFVVSTWLLGLGLHLLRRELDVDA